MTQPERAPNEGYRRGLSVRMIQMMAIGGAVGTGLFYGTGSAIHEAGPGLLIAFAVAGLTIFVIARALGELLDHRPVSGSLYEYPREFLGEFMGFLGGWTYWAAWTTACMAEVTAAGHYLQFWWPHVPVWAAAGVAVCALALINLCSARAFGETEFWLAAVKVVTILGLILLGLVALVSLPASIGGVTLPGVPLHGETAVAHLWDDGGFLPNGWRPVVVVLPLALFSYVGVELLGVTAGEAREPKTALRRAVGSVPLRIAVFYLGSLAVLLCVRGWRSYQEGQSPFVTVFTGSGLPYAAAAVNAVVLTAALSACNSGVYATGRILRALALRGQGPRALARLNRGRVPAAGVLASSGAMGLGVVANVFAPQAAWSALMSLATVGIIIVWGSLLASHWAYRRQIAAGRAERADFRLPFAPYSTAFAGLVLTVVLVEQGFSVQGRVALVVGAVWVALVVSGWSALRR